MIFSENDRFFTLKDIIGDNKSKDEKKHKQPILPISKSSFYKGIQDGIYPKPYKLGKISLWLESEILALCKNIASGKFSEI